MITRSVLAAIAMAAVAAGSSTTVLVTASGNEHGLAQRNARAGAAGQSGETADATQTAEVELPTCPADVKNHGAYVSSVAKANKGHAEGETEETEDAGHGALVSAAAQSDCGKKAGGDEAGEEDETGEDAKTPEEKAAAKAERDAAKAARKAAKGERGASATAPGQTGSTPGEGS